LVSIHHQNARNITAAGVVIFARDVGRSHQWYRDILGLHMELDPTGGSSQYAEAYGVDQRIVVFRIVPGSQKACGTGAVSICFQVDDLEKTVLALKSAGVAVARPISVSPGEALPSAVVLDPDGIEILLYPW